MQSPDLVLIRGTLDLFVLKALSGRPMHGLAVLRWIEHRSGNALQIAEGALYPALHRLERKGWLHSEWTHSDQARRVRSYRLTAAGLRALSDHLSLWVRYTETAAAILRSGADRARGGEPR